MPAASVRPYSVEEDLRGIHDVLDMTLGEHERRIKALEAKAGNSKKSSSSGSSGSSGSILLENRIAALENRLDSMWEQAKRFTSSHASAPLSGTSGASAPFSGASAPFSGASGASVPFSGASASLSGGRATRRAKRSGKKAQKTRSRR